MKAKVLMVQGTTSQAGKSLIVAGLCRIFAKDGFRVAPFNSQNMTYSTYKTPDGKEMGMVQVLQAYCAGAAPDIRMNPVVLRPTSGKCSDVIVSGYAVGNMTARQYAKFKPQLLEPIMEAYRSLACEYDIIIAEGVGSPVEISLSQDTISNMALAKKLSSPVLMVGDIDRGGVIASLLGTSLLLEEEGRSLLKGIIINKFLGERTELDFGLQVLESTVGKPVLGVVPYMKIDLFPIETYTQIAEKEQQIDFLENSIRNSLDINKIYKILHNGV